MGPHQMSLQRLQGAGVLVETLSILQIKIGHRVGPSQLHHSHFCHLPLARLVVSFNLLAPTRIYNQSGALPYKVLLYDASVRFLSQEHLPYFILWH